MSGAQLFRTHASSLAKVKALPRLRHPGDLINAYVAPLKKQRDQIDGVLAFGQNLYLSPAHETLMKNLTKERRSFLECQSNSERELIAKNEYDNWAQYLNKKVADLHNNAQNKHKITEEQRGHIFEAMYNAKQRQEQRLALHRFNKFCYDYASGFKVDLPMNPVILLKLIHPYYGYLLNYPDLKHYKLNHDQLINFIEMIIIASEFREDGHTLHSNELLALIFWKLWLADNDNKHIMSITRFCQFLKVFKFNVQEDSFKDQLKYHIKEGELLPNAQFIRFNLWRTIYLERDL